MYRGFQGYNGNIELQLQVLGDFLVYGMDI